MIGVVLEGGGAKGSYQAGALSAIKKSGIKINGVVGTSIGAINAAFMVQNDHKLLKRLWLGATNKDILGIDDESIKKIKKFTIDKKLIKDSWTMLVNIIKNRGLDNGKLKQLLVDNVYEQKIRKSKMDYGLVTFSISDGKPIQIFKENIPEGKMLDYILASAYFPLFKFEKIIDDKYYFDGGIYDNCPINMLIDKGYDKIIVIRTRGIGIRRKVKKNNVNICFISNEKNLGATIFFDKDVIKDNFYLGYYDALRLIYNLDGINYYIKNRNDKYYDNLISIDYDQETIKKLQKKFKVTKNKDLIIKSIEYILSNEKINKFKVYSIFKLVFMIRFRIPDNDDIIYNFIKSLKLHI